MTDFLTSPTLREQWDRLLREAEGQRGGLLWVWQVKPIVEALFTALEDESRILGIVAGAHNAHLMREHPDG